MYLSSQKAVYANVQDLYQDSGDDDSFGYGDEKIYDSIFYYQSPVSYSCHVTVM